MANDINAIRAQVGAARQSIENALVDSRSTTSNLDTVSGGNTRARTWTDSTLASVRRAISQTEGAMSVVNLLRSQTTDPEPVGAYLHLEMTMSELERQLSNALQIKEKLEEVSRLLNEAVSASPTSGLSIADARLKSWIYRF